MSTIKPLASLSLALALCASACGDEFDLASAFSVTNGNPNGPWTYGWWNPTGGFTPFTTGDGGASPNSPRWFGWGSDGTPAVWRNGQPFTSYGIPSGGISLHPSPEQYATVVRFTAPGGVLARMYGEFTAGDIGAMRVSVRLEELGEMWSATDAGAFQISRAVPALGEHFYFLVGNGYAYGNTGLQLTITLGCGAADVGVQGGLPGRDELLDNNDFVVFIEQFFSLDPRADFGRQGGLAGPDGLFDNNDFVVFIDRFFHGCG